MEMVAVHPALRSPKFGIETVRERVLTNAEIAAVWNALQSIVTGKRNGMTVQTAHMVQLLMLTGARRPEVARATKSEVVGDIWTIPASRMKNKRPHSVPLAAMAAKLFTDAMAASQSDTYVFAGRGSECADPTSIGHSLDNLTANLGIEDAHPHDLRRTLASELGRMGVPEETISRSWRTPSKA
jgi:integrase